MSMSGIGTGPTILGTTPRRVRRRAVATSDTKSVRPLDGHHRFPPAGLPRNATIGTTQKETEPVELL